MAAYCIFNVLEVTDPDKMQEYKKRGTVTIAKYGGKIICAGGKQEVVEGEWQPGIMIIIEFSSLDEAKKWYNSKEYEQLKLLRFPASKANAIFLEGI